MLMNIETTWKVKYYFKLQESVDASVPIQLVSFKNTNFTYLFTNPSFLITTKIRYIDEYFITELKSHSFLTTMIGLELLAVSSYFI